MKIAFYVSNNAARLTKAVKQLVEHHELNNLLDEIKFIFRDSEVNDELYIICNMLGIRFIQNNMQDVKDKSSAVSDKLFQLVKEMNIDYLIVFGSRILKGEILSEYKNRIINFHPSLLPAFPGIKSIDQAVKYGSFLLGNTAHFIDEGIDTGSIIMQNIYVLNGDIDYDEILDRQIPMLFQILIWLRDNRIIVADRRVSIKNAKYSLDDFIPNLEIKYQFLKGKSNEAVS